VNELAQAFLSAAQSTARRCYAHRDRQGFRDRQSFTSDAAGAVLEWQTERRYRPHRTNRRAAYND